MKRSTVNTEEDRQNLIKSKHKHADFNPDFSFDWSGKAQQDCFDAAMFKAERRGNAEIAGRCSLEDKIMKARQKKVERIQKGEDTADKEPKEQELDEQKDEVTLRETKQSKKDIGDAIRVREIKKINHESSDEDQDQHFSEDEGLDDIDGFQDFKLCRPLLKAIKGGFYESFFFAKNIFRVEYLLLKKKKKIYDIQKFCEHTIETQRNNKHEIILINSDPNNCVGYKCHYNKLGWHDQ